MSIYTETTKEVIEQDIRNFQPQFELTELGNAYRFKTITDGRLIHMYEDNEWYVYNGVKWVLDEGSACLDTYKLILEQLQDEIYYAYAILEQYKLHTDLSEPLIKQLTTKIDDIRKWRCASQSNQRITASIKLGSKERELIKKKKDFDTKGHFIGTSNGVYNLKKNVLVTNDPQYLITKTANAIFEENAVCPQWDSYIEIITSGDKEHKQFLQRIAGECLLGSKKEKMIVLHSLKGKYGKSTFVDTLADVVGEYSTHLDSKVILSDYSNKEYYLAGLKGVRLAIMQETEVDAHMAKGLIKGLIDTAGMSGRLPRGIPFQFDPICTPIITTNHIPFIGNDDAAWRRILVVPFLHQIPDNIENKNFRTDVLDKERSGILNWMIEGCKMYLQWGLNPPKWAVDATNQERVEQDRLQSFIDTYCDVEEQGSIVMTDFRRVLTIWLKENGNRELSSQNIKSQLLLKGYVVNNDTKNNNKGTVYGLAFNFDVTTFIDLDDAIKQKVENNKKLERQDLKEKLGGFKNW